MMTIATDAAADIRFGLHISAMRTRRGRDGIDYAMIMPLSLNTGYLAMLDTIGQNIQLGPGDDCAMQDLLLAAVHTRPFAAAMTGMAVSALKSGQPHFANVALMLDALVESFSEWIPGFVADPVVQRGGYSMVTVNGLV